MLREALTLDRLRVMEPDEAAAYFVACGADGLTENERALMADWLCDSATHSAALERAQRAWDSFGDADDDEILCAMRIHARAAPAVAAPLLARPAWRVAAGAAAALLLIVAAGMLLIPGLGRTPQPGAAQGTTIEYASAATGTSEVVLPDGSHMTLDANSAVRGRFVGEARGLQMVRGRAYFDVRHDSARPFTVTTATRRIVDMGTRFDVDVTGGSLRVTLEQGRVSVQALASGAPPVLLRPGQQFVETGNQATVRTLGNGDVSSDWRRGLISLDDTSLAEAAAQINRYSATQIVIRDAQVGRIRVSGQFRTGDAERFARTIAELHPVRVVRRENTVEILPAK